MARTKININELKNKDEIIDKIINQANSLNKKIKKFKVEGISDHYQYVTSLLSNNDNVFNENGTITKSKQIYKEMSIPMLKRTLSMLHKTNNHEILGTTNKYKKAVNSSLQGVKTYAKNHLEKLGYSEQFIQEVTNNNGYLMELVRAFNEGVEQYGSDNIIEKVALTYEDTGLDNKEVNRRLSDIESAVNKINELDEYQSAVDEVMRNRRKR